MNPRRFSSPRTFPMPLWLQGVTEAVITALVGLALMLLLFLPGWLSVGAPGGLTAPLIGGGQLWLVAQAVPLNFSIAAGMTHAAAAGTLSVAPLGLMLLLLWLDRRAGQRLARASYEGQFWQPVLGAVLARAGIGALICWATATPSSAGLLWAAVVGPALVAAAGLLWGGRRVSGSWLRLLGATRERLARRHGQREQWAGLYAVALLRAASVVVTALIAGGALLAGISAVWHWEEILAVQQSLHAGLLGDLSLTLVHAALLPNLVIWAMAWATGAGFALGDGSTVSPAITQVEAFPALPLLQAIPQDPGTYGFAVLLVPVLAGAAGAWWFLREGENHLDDWFALKISPRWVSAPVSAVVFALLLGSLSGAGAGLLAWLASGSVGITGFGAVGAAFGPVWLWTAITVAVGALIGQLVSPIIERDEAAAAELRRQRERRRRAAQRARAERAAARGKKGAGKATAEKTKTEKGKTEKGKDEKNKDEKVAAKRGAGGSGPYGSW